jgi:hypothetical protein
VKANEAETLSVLARYCVNVRTIEISLCHSRYDVEDPHCKKLTEVELSALTKVDTAMRVFKTVDTILVEHYYNTGKQNELLRRIAPLGWTMKGRKHPYWDDDPLIFCGGPDYGEDEWSDLEYR